MLIISATSSATSCLQLPRFMWTCTTTPPLSSFAHSLSMYVGTLPAYGCFLSCNIMCIFPVPTRTITYIVCSVFNLHAQSHIVCSVLGYGFYVQYIDASYGCGCTLPSSLLGYLFGHVTSLCTLLGLLLKESRPSLVWFPLHGAAPALWCWLFLGTAECLIWHWHSVAMLQSAYTWSSSLWYSIVERMVCCMCLTLYLVLLHIKWKCVCIKEEENAGKRRERGRGRGREKERGERGG